MMKRELSLFRTVAAIFIAAVLALGVMVIAPNMSFNASAQQDVFDLFANNEGSEVTIENGKGYTPTATGGVLDTRYGVMLSTSTTGTVAYNSAIKLNNSLETPFIEFMIAMPTQGSWTKDFGKLTVTLTDKADDTKKIAIDYSVDPSTATLTTIKAAASGQTMAGWHRNADTAAGKEFAGDALHSGYGTFVNFGFDGGKNTGGIPDYTGGFTSIKLFLKDNALYANPTRWANNGEDKSLAYTKIRDFGSSDKYGTGFGVTEDTAFAGLTSGEAYLSIKMDSITANKSAKVLVIGINGQSLKSENGKFTDNLKPEVSFQQNAYKASYFTGEELTIVTPTVYDILDGEFEYNGTITITKDGATVTAVDEKITLEKGNYKIKYENCVDLGGENAEAKEFDFTVVDPLMVAIAADNKGEFTTYGTKAITYDKNDLTITVAEGTTYTDLAVTIKLLKDSATISSGATIALTDTLVAGAYKVEYAYSLKIGDKPYTGTLIRDLTITEGTKPGDIISDKKGCGSVAASGTIGGIVALIALGGACLLVLKRNKKQA